MSFANTIAAELRVSLKQLDRLSPSHRDPEHYHVLKSEIRHRIEQATLMLEGQFDIIMPEPKPSGHGRRKRPEAIVDAKGNVIEVDFKTRTRLPSPRRRP